MANNSYFYNENYVMFRQVSGIFLVILVLFTACAAKRLAKQAARLESAGMFREAAELYYQATISRPNEVEYRIGLKRSGQMYVNECEQNISRAFSEGNHKKVVYDYLSMQNFIQLVKNTGIELSLDAGISRKFEISRDYYLSERYEEALRLLNEKQYYQAREIFQEIQKIKPDYGNVSSYINITTLEPLYQNGLQLFNQKKYIEAYREWEKVALQDPTYKDVSILMQQALAERYREGSLWLMQENFNAAATALGDVYKINPDYLEVRNLYIEARNEPIYRKASADLQIGKCRSAYFDFDKIIKDAGTYKNASRLKEEALNCARFPVAIGYSGTNKISTDLEFFENTLFNKILESKDPFLQLHKLALLNSSIDRNLRSSGEMPTQNKLSELYEKHQVKALLIITFNEFTKSEGNLEKIERTGFEQQRTISSTGESVISFKKVNYFEFKKQNVVSLNLSYQLVSTRNGQILLSQRINDSQSDVMHYASYEGDPRDLYPAIKTENGWQVNESGYHSLQKLLRASRQIKNVNQLRNQLFYDCSEKISLALINFNPEK